MLISRLNITNAYQSLSTPSGKMKPSSLRSRLRAHWLWFALLFAVVPAAAAGPRLAPYTFAMIEFRSGHFQQARQALENALRRSPANATAEMEMLVARCDFELGDLNGATAHAEEAVRIDPANAQYHLWLGRMVGSEADRERSVTLAMKTRKEFEEAVKLAPSSADARRALMEYYLDAPWVLGGSKAKAKEQAEAISRLDPIEGLLARARMDEASGQSHQADSDYRQVIQAKPQRLGPYFEAADFYLHQQDASGLALAAEAAAAVNASDPRIDYYRAVADVLAGSQLASAQQELDEYLADAPARRDFPSRAEALNWLGKLYERMGKTRLAVEQYHSALQKDPENGEAHDALQRLGKVQ